MEPTTLVSVTGSMAAFKCTIKGQITDPVHWFQNGERLKINEYSGRVHLQGDKLIISNVKNTDFGIYQCAVRNKDESVQASASLILGDAPPQFRFTFSEQALRVGQQVSLKCIASGDPTPIISWILDGKSIPTSLSQRYALDQYIDGNGDIVSRLNVTFLQAEDGGLYGCNATNNMGRIIHQARLDVYGPPYIRFITPIHAVAETNISIICPYSGYPISSVKWDKKGGDISEKSDTVHIHSDGRYPGTLYISKVKVDHAGTYTCTVSGPSGGLARREMHLVVHKPPKLLPFSFPSNLEEGESVQATCSASSGDKPMYFSWFKDAQPLNPNLKIELQNMEFFSLLIIPKVTAAHNGFYTCRAVNNVADKNVTSELVVKVSPQWLMEPQNISALSSSSLMITCSAKGHPKPSALWAKTRDLYSDVFHSISQNSDALNVEGMSLLQDGSLWFPTLKSSQAGRYQCTVDNKVGKPLSKTIYLSVNEPARVTSSVGNVTTRHGGSVSLTCTASGDAPLTLTWLRGPHRLIADSRRIIVMETRTDSSLSSELTVKDTNNEDSGLYKCHAENVFGHSETKMYLIVQERPKPPLGLQVLDVGSRSVHLSWKKGYDGGSQIISYLIQYQPVVGPLRGPSIAKSWSSGNLFNVSVGHHQLQTERVGSDDIERAVVNGLKPATEYLFRMLAFNEIFHSSYSETITVRMQEEAPSEAPRNLEVRAIRPKELQISWQVPPPASWNGELLGFIIYWKEEEVQNKEEAEKMSKVRGGQLSSFSITGLKQFTKYSISASAYNVIGDGPRATPVTGSTQEGVPEVAPTNVSCMTMSSMSLRVWWRPPPQNLIFGILQGYKVHYIPLLAEDDDKENSPESEGEVKRSGGTETVLRALRRYTKYSVRVRAYTSVGDGLSSHSITCTTDEDVPGILAGFKTATTSSSAIVVSWLPPETPNGVIIHNTLYIKEIGRQSKVTSIQIPANNTRGDILSDNQPVTIKEFQYPVRGLLEGASYELWMSASTKVGEGTTTATVVQQPSSKAPARILSFGGLLRAEFGRSSLLRCSVGGAPTPQIQWYKGSIPLYTDGKKIITPHGHLLLSDVDESSSGLYVCTAHNTAGTDRLQIMLTSTHPSPPLRLTLLSAQTHSLRVSMPAVLRNVAHLHYRPISHDGRWETVNMQPGSTEYTIKELNCATVYQIYVTTHKSRNIASEDIEKYMLTVRTAGGAPFAPKGTAFLTVNDTALNMDTSDWLDVNENMMENCGPVRILVEAKSRNDPGWRFVPTVTAPAPILLYPLTPATWYRLKITATNDAGTTVSFINVATTTETGNLVAPPPDLDTYFDDNYIDSLSIIMMCAAGTLIGVTILFVLLKLHRPKCKCSGVVCGEWSHQGVDEITPQKEEANALPNVSFHGISAKRSMVDMYEISPYATFNGAPETEECGSPISSNFDYALNMRTFSCDGDDDAESVHRQARQTKQTRHCDRNRRGSKASSRMHQRYCQQHNEEIQSCLDSDQAASHLHMKNYEKIHRDGHFNVNSDFLQRHAMTLQMSGPPR